ncbi:hypothetical protein [Zhihengliuella halotolerans]|uniref:hypothetical protein n=1 Tax=Zhihengliuella halotolerans TaxID=370736 RepID=UPI000C80254F|nr:hypothetical protein [Zhihengliuella halotolerans]
MQTRLVSYAPFDARQGVLPDALESTLVTPLGELPTVQVHYHRAGVNAFKLDGLTELGFEYWDGSAWVEPPQCRFLSMTGGFDHLEDTPTRKYAFVGVGWMLRRAKVWEAGALPVDADGKVQFLSASAGTIMDTLIQNAQTRGWGAGLSIDFDANTDSDGQAWAKIITIAYDLDLDLEAILTNLYQQGVCDYRWEGRTLRIFNPDTVMGRDLTLGASPLRLVVADGQTSAPEEWTNEDLLTNARVVGEDGQAWTFENDMVSPLGRLEQVITQGGVSDEGTASLLADSELVKGSKTRISYTREFVIDRASAVWPLRDYLPGDWVSAQRGTEFERLRTHSVSLTVTADGVKGHAVLGDRLEDLLTKLAKRTKGITGGASAGGSGARPAPEGPDTRSPSAPDGLLAASNAYLDKDGFVQGVVSLDWAHDGLATDGTAIDVDRYQVYYRENIVGAIWSQLVSTQQTEAAYSPLPVGTPQEPAEFAFKVRAIAATGRASAFSDQYVAVMEQDTTPPPAPEFRAEDVTTSLRTVTVTWSGKGWDGSAAVDMPLDFKQVNLWQGTSATGPWTLVGSTRSEGLVHQTRTMPLETVWYSLTAVDGSGNESERSDVFDVTPTANVDLGDFFDHMDASQVQIENAGQALLEAGQTLDQKLADADAEISQSKDRLTDAESELLETFGGLVVPNHGFEREGEAGVSSAAHWEVTSGQVAREDHPEATGGYLMRLTSPTGSDPLARVRTLRSCATATGTIYSVSLRAKRETAGTNTGSTLLRVGIRVRDSNGATWANVDQTIAGSAELPVGSWVTLRTELTIPSLSVADARYAFFDVTGWGGSGEIVVDDVRVTNESGAIAASTAANAEKIAEEAIGKATNIIANSGFERNLEGWTGNVVIETGALAYKGDRSAFFLSSAAHALSQSSTLIEEGTILDYGVWVRQPSTTAALGRIALQLQGGGSDTIAHEVDGFANTGTGYKNIPDGTRSRLRTSSTGTPRRRSASSASPVTMSSSEPTRRI